MMLRYLLMPQNAWVLGMFVFALPFILLFAGCAKDKTKEQLKADELSQKALAHVKKHKQSSAIPYIEELVTRFPDHQNISKYRMLLAELHFKEGNYALAKELYENFCQFYPADKQAEYAKHKAILSSFYQALPSDCDQTYTEETVKQCNEYLANPALTKYRKDVQDILTSSQERLTEKEIYVFNFYLGRKQFDAARSRLKHIREKFAANKALEPRLLYLEYKLAAKEKKRNEALVCMNKLEKDYPSSAFTTMAHSLHNKQTFVF